QLRAQRLDVLAEGSRAGFEFRAVCGRNLNAWRRHAADLVRQIVSRSIGAQVRNCQQRAEQEKNAFHDVQVSAQSITSEWFVASRSEARASQFRPRRA